MAAWLNVVGRSSRPGWVEHDPEDLDDQLDVMRSAVERAGIESGEIAGIGITNQHETVLLWDHRRTPAPCDRLAGPAHERECARCVPGARSCSLTDRPAVRSLLLGNETALAPRQRAGRAGGARGTRGRDHRDLADLEADRRTSSRQRRLQRLAHPALRHPRERLERRAARPLRHPTDGPARNRPLQPAPRRDRGRPARDAGARGGHDRDHSRPCSVSCASSRACRRRPSEPDASP